MFETAQNIDERVLEELRVAGMQINEIDRVLAEGDFNVVWAKTNVGLGRPRPGASGEHEGGGTPMTHTLHRYGRPEDFRDDYIGNSIKGSAHRATKDLRPTVHWNRDHSPDPQAVIDEVDRPTTVSAVFDNPEAMQAFVAELKALDLGLSVNISGVVERAVECCRETGLTRHSVEYSLGFQGAVEKMPEDAGAGVRRARAPRGCPRTPRRSMTSDIQLE